jgi:hypothetical protein
MSWFENMSHFEITVVVLLALLLLSVWSVSLRLVAIAKILALGGQIQQVHVNDLPSNIADGLDEHERRVNQEISKDLIDPKS